MEFQFDHLLAVSFLTFLIILSSFIISPTKSQKSIIMWSCIMVIFFSCLVGSWFTSDMSLQWVLIEGSTLLGAFLISMSRTSKSIEAAWKFMLLNSFGLGLAFIGLLILSFMVKGQTSFDIEKIRPLIGSHKGPVLEIGFWLIIFGYSSKLGIFPNFFWVSDTYAESPSQSSCLIASFLPVTISIAMDKILDLEPLVFHGNVTPRNFLLVSGVITIMYSLWTLFQTFDIRRISAQVALFHTGGLAIILWLNPTEQIFYILLSINIIVKSFLFLTMGLMRMESGSRNIESILSKGEISKVVSIFYVLGVTFSLGFPLSPAFSSDLIIIIESLKKDHYIALIIPFAASIFLSIVVYRIIPVLALPHRSAKGSDDVLIRNRLIHVIILFLFLAVSGLFSLYVVSKKAGLM